MTTQAQTLARRPIVPEDLPRRDPGRALCRAAFAVARNHLSDTKLGPERTAESLFPNDRAAIAITKAAVNPASIGSVSWAGQLSPTITGEFVSSLVGMSAGARLIDAGMKVSLDGKYEILLPHRTANLPNVDVQWVAEGAPFPVRSLSLATSILGPPKKLICSAVATRELLLSPSGESAIGQLLREDVAASLDASLFSNAAASATRPAGLLAGISALSPTAGGGEGALRGDLGLIGGAVAAATGSGNLAFITSPTGAVKLLTFPTVIDLDADQVNVWPSIAVAAGTLICIAIDAFVSAFGPVPKIATSTESVVHMEDSAPLPIGSPGPVVAAPARSLWQTDSIAIRCILDAAWALRSTGAAAWVQGATW
jgi:hypothetical protein